MKMTRLHSIPLAVVLLSLANHAFATDVVVTGLFSNKAMVIVDGGRPHMLSAGQTYHGVKLLRADSENAVLEFDGNKQTLGLGQRIATAYVSSDKPTLKLTADGYGHFSTMGSINGFPIRFMVDTGASFVSISASEARRMGIDYRHGQQGYSSTANGAVATYKVTLNNVKIGSISLNGVEAAVLEGQGMPTALLGNSALSRLDMKREGERLTLTQRY